MTITKVEAKNKLSQNRSMADQLGAIEGLMGEPDPQAEEIAAVMQGSYFRAGLRQLNPRPSSSEQVHACRAATAAALWCDRRSA